MSNQLQQELALLGELTNELRELDARLVARCESMPRAYRLCMDRAKPQRTQDQWAELLGLKPSHFKQMLSTNPERKKYMPAEKEEDLMLIAGNKAPEQWRRLYRSRMLDCQRSLDDQIQEARATLAALESQR